MTLQAPALRRFDIGNVISNMGRSISQNAGTFFGLSAVLYGFPAAILGFIQFLLMRPMLQAAGGAASGDPSAFGGAPEQLFRTIAITAGLGLISWLLIAVLQAAVIHGVVHHLLGRRASIGDCLRTGVRFMLPSILIGIVTGIGVVFGMILLIVPGIILALGWSVSVPVAVLEGKGVFASIGRSWSLTDGHKWSIFLLGVIYFVIAMVLGVVVSGAGGPFMMANMEVYFLVNSVLLTPLMNTVIYVIATAGIASIYFELRQVKEGIGAETMASVFA